MQEKETSPGNPPRAHGLRLLFPADRRSSSGYSSAQLAPGVWRDLSLDTMAAAFSTNHEYQIEVAKILATLLHDPDVIRYRQDVIKDLLNNPSMVRRLTDFLPVIDSLTRYSFHPGVEMNTLHEVAWRIGEIQNIVDCIHGLADMFNEVRGRLVSAGLTNLEKEIQEISQDATFQKLDRELPELLSKIRRCASITIGVNLDPSLRPVQATLLSVNDEAFTDQSLLNKLFGVRKDGEGIAPLHSVPLRIMEGPVAIPLPAELGRAVEPLMVPLFADLSKVLEKTAKPVAQALRQYSEVQGNLFVNLRHDLVFYLGAVQFIQKIQELGLPVCQPEITPFSSRVCEVHDSFNPSLALNSVNKMNGELHLSEMIVKNNIRFGPEGEILILTGPNRGGKTTYMQGVGLVQVLAQAGCFVPGERAQISLVDNIYTHFPLEEKPAMQAGRLGEEASRLAQVFQQVTRNSLVLLNESLASTSSGESLYLATDILKALRRLGARAIYSTHLHELAEHAAEINASVKGDSTVISVVSSPVDLSQSTPDGDIIRTYKIEARPPLGRSYAKEIAVRYGISYDQLEEVLNQRGVLE